MNKAPSSLAADSPDGLNSILLLFICLIGVITVCTLIALLGSGLAKRTGRRKTRAEWLGGIALLSVCVTIALYIWGALHVMFMESDTMREACAKAGSPEKAAQVDRYSARYLPLRFTCQIDKGGSYDAAVPGYVNPAMGIAFALAIATGTVSVVTRDQNRSTSPTVTRGR
ncbi:hypothetical protein JK364_42100 [Streptomyces sp. 110]|uniref:DUF4190 domain-containing protein n=1 Tax=Streptomyces endocoffeicus TaxID=2898945 RepID=A0ABS1Q423_9ACTN|nr:hypothetical protein [Streptomyces endocoffeicus]MBL1118912.1 hypothetical protein [Streptomyces endocoffeicus]